MRKVWIWKISGADQSWFCCSCWSQEDLRNWSVK
ncbi:hypothetical protein BRARA_B00915 [Brassica rapa]|uniref:Uncharacterized protein n=1 Tax=Brassica campestris TaxID=3711 RepID=A0A398A7H8_BRACM|nr:hypothetical protein BRARA_B00915 [Brassica rapa]